MSSDWNKNDRQVRRIRDSSVVAQRPAISAGARSIQRFLRSAPEAKRKEMQGRLYIDICEGEGRRPRNDKRSEGALLLQPADSRTHRDLCAALLKRNGKRYVVNPASLETSMVNLPQDPQTATLVPAIP